MRPGGLQRFQSMMAAPRNHGLGHIAVIQTPAVSRIRWPVSKYCGPSRRVCTLWPPERPLPEGVNWNCRPVAVGRLEQVYDRVAAVAVGLQRQLSGSLTSAATEFAPSLPQCAQNGSWQLLRAVIPSGIAAGALHPIAYRSRWERGAKPHAACPVLRCGIASLLAITGCRSVMSCSSGSKGFIPQNAEATPST